MPQEPKKQQKKSTAYFQTLFSQMDEMLATAVTQEEMVDAIKAVVEVVKKAEARISETVAKNKGITDSDTRALQESIRDLEARVARALEDTKAEGGQSLTQAIAELREEMNEVQAQIPELPDYTERFAEIEAKIPSLPPEKLGEDYRNALEALVGDDRLAMEAIRGLIDKLESLEKRPSGGSVARGLYFLIDGVKKGIISNMNFKAGSNMAIAYSKTNGQDTITFTSSGGGAGSTVETPPETPNASTTVFTVTAEPKFMVADGVTYFDGAGYTYSALQVTFDVPPSASVRAII